MDDPRGFYPAWKEIDLQARESIEDNYVEDLRDEYFRVFVQENSQREFHALIAEHEKLFDDMGLSESYKCPSPLYPQRSCMEPPPRKVPDEDVQDFSSAPYESLESCADVFGPLSVSSVHPVFREIEIDGTVVAQQPYVGFSMPDVPAPMTYHDPDGEIFEGCPIRLVDDRKIFSTPVEFLHQLLQLPLFEGWSLNSSGTPRDGFVFSLRSGKERFVLKVPPDDVLLRDEHLAFIETAMSRAGLRYEGLYLRFVPLVLNAILYRFEFVQGESKWTILPRDRPPSPLDISRVFGAGCNLLDYYLFPFYVYARSKKWNHPYEAVLSYMRWRGVDLRDLQAMFHVALNIRQTDADEPLRCVGLPHVLSTLVVETMPYFLQVILSVIAQYENVQHPVRFVVVPRTPFELKQLAWLCYQFSVPMTFSDEIRPLSKIIIPGVGPAYFEEPSPVSLVSFFRLPAIQVASHRFFASLRTVQLPHDANPQLGAYVRLTMTYRRVLSAHGVLVAEDDYDARARFIRVTVLKPIIGIKAICDLVNNAHLANPCVFRDRAPAIWSMYLVPGYRRPIMVDTHDFMSIPDPFIENYSEENFSYTVVQPVKYNDGFRFFYGSL